MRLLGNGQKISVWNNNWIPVEGGLKNPCPLCPMSLVSQHSEVVIDLLHGKREQRDIYKIRSRFSNDKDIGDILRTHILGSKEEDVRVWMFTNTRASVC